MRASRVSAARWAWVRRVDSTSSCLSYIRYVCSCIPYVGCSTYSTSSDGPIRPPGQSERFTTMPSSTLKAIEADRDALLALCRGLEDSVWSQNSGCRGWTVQDLVSHMACSFWLAVDMSKLPDSAGLPAERAADLYVDSRRSMTPAEILADYDSASA